MIQVLESLLSRSHKDGRIVSATLCSTSIEHIKTGFKDWGWGCGCVIRTLGRTNLHADRLRRYRNMMMIFSSLRHMNSYAHLGGKGKSPMAIPCIYEFQTLLEEAWQHGFDQDGAKHFKHKLRNSKKWIGTTEVYTGLTWLGIRFVSWIIPPRVHLSSLLRTTSVRIVDFPKTRGNDGVHYALIVRPVSHICGIAQLNRHLQRWIKSYFESPLDPAAPSGSTSKKRSSSPPPSAHERLMASSGSPVRMSKKQPLYLQHDGHSRTVVGIEINKNGEWLIIFDPSKCVFTSIPLSSFTHFRMGHSNTR